MFCLEKLNFGINEIYILGGSEDETYIGDFVELYAEDDEIEYTNVNDFLEIKEEYLEIEEENLDYVDYGRVKVIQRGLMNKKK